MKAAPIIFVCLAETLLGIIPQAALGEPHLIIGPTEQDEAPEVVETISGLSYDQLKRLRELRKWLEQRQMIREQIQLQETEDLVTGSPERLFSDRQLFAPMGQRSVEAKPRPRLTPEQMKLPPLPRFDEEGAVVSGDETMGDATVVEDESLADETPATSRPRVTHISPPPLALDRPQIEYELNPER